MHTYTHVCTCINLSTHSSILCLSMHTLTYPPVPSFIPPSMYSTTPSNSSCVYLPSLAFMHSCIYQTTHSSMFGLPPFLPLSIHPTSHQSLHPFINPLIHPCMHPPLHSSPPHIHPGIPSTSPFFSLISPC